jgi:hypothetical protein
MVTGVSCQRTRAAATSTPSFPNLEQSLEAGPQKDGRVSAEGNMWGMGSYAQRGNMHQVMLDCHVTTVTCDIFVCSRGVW